MQFNERKQYLYDPDLFGLNEVQTALKIHHEYVTRMSGRPRPVFCEVDRSAGAVDGLWHMPVASRTTFTREIEIPSIVQFNNLKYASTRRGREPGYDGGRFWVSNTGLQAAKYFPVSGDVIKWGGYRFEVGEITFDSSSYWQQTNVWLGLVVLASILPDGDAKPLISANASPPIEKAQGL